MKSGIASIKFRTAPKGPSFKSQHMQPNIMADTKRYAASTPQPIGVNVKPKIVTGAIASSAYETEEEEYRP